MTTTNKVELLGSYGGDETHALSAWTSTKRELTEEKRGRIDKLLAQLARDKHTTPFEKSALHFLVTCDTASHIHMLKHRIAVSINGESARYKEHKEDKYYLPEDWPEEFQGMLQDFTEQAFIHYHQVLEMLVSRGFSRKRAKESARFFLPYNSQLTLDVQFNFQSFMHFQGLRNKPDAQDEIAWIAQAMLDQVRELGTFKYSLEAFGYGQN